MARAMNVAYALMVEDATAEGFTRAQLVQAMRSPQWGQSPVKAAPTSYDRDAGIEAMLHEDGLTMDDLLSAD